MNQVIPPITDCFINYQDSVSFHLQRIILPDEIKGKCVKSSLVNNLCDEIWQL